MADGGLGRTALAGKVIDAAASCRNCIGEAGGGAGGFTRKTLSGGGGEDGGEG